MKTMSRRDFTLAGLTVCGGWAAGATARWTAAGEAPGERPRLGTLAPRASREIARSPLGVGFETLDREMFDPGRTYQHLAALGVKWARAQTGWARCETQPGRYDFAWLDEIVDALLHAGVQPWFNLGYGNRLYTPDAPDVSAVGWAPMGSETARRGWERFVAALAEHFRDRVRHWEIWNEPNLRHFWQPTTPSPAGYVELVKQTAPVIRSRIEDAVIIGGAFSAMPDDFLEGCLKLGLADQVDRISYHPYALIPEKGYVDAVTAWRGMLARYKPSLALWQGECGCPSSEGGVGALSQYRWNEARQVKWLLRRTLLDLSLGLEMISYFHLVDLVRYRWTGRVDAPPEGTQVRTNFRADFGLLRGDDYSPKPAYAAYQRVCSLFDGETAAADLPAAVTSKLDAANAKAAPEGVFCARFVRKSYPIYAWWWPGDVQNDFAVEKIELAVGVSQSVALERPVLVDLLDGQVYEIQGDRRGGQWRFAALPLADYPMLITDAKAVVDG